MGAGVDRLVIAVGVSTLVHAAVLAGIVGNPRLAVTGAGASAAVSVRLVPEGRPKATETAVATAVPHRRQAASNAAIKSASSDASAADNDARGDGQTQSASTGRSGEAPAEPDQAGSSSAPEAAGTDAASAGETDATTDDSGARANAHTDRSRTRPPQPTAASGARGQASQRQLAQRARAAVERELARYFHYPRLARQRGWEGRVVLRLRITSGGRIEAVTVVDSSGRAILDRAAREALARVKRLPGLADAPMPRALVLNLPVTYRLEAG